MTVHLNDLDFDVTGNRIEVEAAWQTLNADPLNSLHQSPVWCDAWAATQKSQLLFLRGTLDGTCYLLLPLVRKQRACVSWLELPAKGYNNINTGLVHSELIPAKTSLSLALAQQRIAEAIVPHADLLTLSNLPLMWRDRQSPFTGLPSVQNQNPAFQLPLLLSFDETLRQLNAKRRRKKFRNSQRIAQDFGGYQYRIAETDADKLHILRQFFEQKARRFADHGLPDVFVDDAIQQFFANLVLVSQTDQSDQALELHYLELCGENLGRIAAITGISRKGDHCICQFGSIDENLAGALSPGELLFYHVIERENGLGSKLFDFGAGDQRYKRSWCPVITVHNDIHLAATLKGKLLATLLRLSTIAKTFIKSNAFLYRLLQKIRRQSQQGGED